MYVVYSVCYNTSTRPPGPSPREAFLGRALDAKKDFSCAFGDYVEATIAQADNTTTARTQPCVAMLPTGKLTGSVTMLSLTTGRLVRRDQFRILPTSQYVVDKINEVAAADGHVSQEHAEGVHPSTLWKLTRRKHSTLPSWRQTRRKWG